MIGNRLLDQATWPIQFLVIFSGLWLMFGYWLLDGWLRDMRGTSDD